MDTVTKDPSSEPLGTAELRPIVLEVAEEIGNPSKKWRHVYGRDVDLGIQLPEGCCQRGSRGYVADLGGHEILSGYLGHQLIVDADDPGHLLVVSWWASRKAADEVLEEYREHPNARRANELVSQPRRRFLGRPLDQGFE